MPRGRQYYDPIIQAPSKVESAPARRIELYPEHDIRDNVESPRWVARLIGDDGMIVQHSPGSFDHDDSLRQALEMWPGLEVYELREESEDSTHEGMGPSPRLWQNAQSESQPLRVVDMPALDNGDEIMGGPEPDYQPPEDSRALRAFVAPAVGAYVLIEDIVVILEDYAVQYDEQGNPSGALALREAAAALKEPF